MKKLKCALLAFSMVAVLWTPILAEDEGESQAPVAGSGVPKPGNGVSTFVAGTSVPEGGVSLILNYNFFSTTHTPGARVYRNVFAPVLRVGIGNQWDIVVQVPMTFTIQDGKRNPSGNNVGSGVNGRTLVWFHKQHLAKKFENSSIMVATNYSLSIPTNSGMTGFWGFGFGVGLTWDYLSMRGVFDIQATASTKGASGTGASPLTLWIKAGYHYAFTNYVYAGLELNWDSSIYSSAYNGYTGNGSHNVYLGPILSFKIPELNGSAWGVGFFWDVANQYQDTQQRPKWKEAWRLTSRITAMF